MYFFLYYTWFHYDFFLLYSGWCFRLCVCFRTENGQRKRFRFIVQFFVIPNVSSSPKPLLLMRYVGGQMFTGHLHTSHERAVYLMYRGTCSTTPLHPTRYCKKRWPTNCVFLSRKEQRTLLNSTKNCQDVKHFEPVPKFWETKSRHLRHKENHANNIETLSSQRRVYAISKSVPRATWSNILCLATDRAVVYLRNRLGISYKSIRYPSARKRQDTITITIFSSISSALLFHLPFSIFFTVSYYRCQISENKLRFLSL